MKSDNDHLAGASTAGRTILQQLRLALHDPLRDMSNYRAHLIQCLLDEAERELSAVRESEGQKSEHSAVAARELAATMLDETAAHIKENAEALRKYPWGEQDEARCRELSAMYLTECAACLRMENKLAALASVVGTPQDVSPPNETEPAVEAMKRDAERMDWLETQHVKVAQPLRYGSRDRFRAGPGEEDEPSDLRAAIDAAMQAPGTKERTERPTVDARTFDAAHGLRSDE